jgi:site-specific DNA recombinase
MLTCKLSSMSRPVRAAILVRISDDRAGDAAGVGRQEADARALADRLGWQIGEVVIENDVSAYKRRQVTLPDGSTALRVVRPGFRRLLELLSLGQVDGLIAYDLDRVARDPRDLEDLIDVVEQARVPVESVTGSLRLANDSDITMARVMVAVANKSSRDSSRRIARKHEQLAQEGKYGGGGARRYGFEPDGVTHVPAEADAIRWAAQRVIDGASLKQTCRELDARGVPTVRGGKWTSTALRDILRGPRVAGLRVHRGESVGSAAWAPILDMDTWQAVCAAVAARDNGAGRIRLKRWLNGVLICSLCGEGLAGQFVKGGSYRYWCSTERSGCGKIAIHGPGVEAEIERQVLDYLSRPDVIAALIEASSAQGAERARADLAADEAQLKTLAAMWANKDITLNEYAEARTIIEKRIEDARAVMATALPGRVRAVLRADNIPKAWSELPPAGKREVALTLVKGWRVNPAHPAKPRRFDASRLEVVPRG